MEDKIVATINSLPDEIITMILFNVSLREKVSFGCTNKRFNRIVNETQSLWKYEFKKPLQNKIFETVDAFSDGDWLNELKRFHIIKKQIQTQLITMSHKLYWKVSPVSAKDIDFFFHIAMIERFNYYYTIFILQEFIKTVTVKVDQFDVEQPYTMTGMHYAKIILRYLFHFYLTVKWAKSCEQNSMPPEMVLNFFLQWTDTTRIHSDEEIEDNIQEIVEEVKMILNKNHGKLTSGGSEKRVYDKGNISEQDILAAIAEVIFRQRCIVGTSSTDLCSLNIPWVIRIRSGSLIAIAAIYHAVARKLGVHLELVCFPHLFLVWTCRDPPMPVVFYISLNNGEIHRRRCPYSTNQGHSSFSKYCQTTLLQYIQSRFREIDQSNRSLFVHNVYSLINLFEGDIPQSPEDHPYRNFMPFIRCSAELATLNTQYGLEYLDSSYISLIQSLTVVNDELQPIWREKEKKLRTSQVLYAVGMICYHKKALYLCVIRAWDPFFIPRSHPDPLLHGPHQPFYEVVAVNHSITYVAQENLMFLDRAARLPQLEDEIAADFTHFDGFAYVPNDDKREEYPDDAAVVQYYKLRMQLMHGSSSCP